MKIGVTSHELVCLADRHKLRRAMGSAASAVPDTPESELQRYALHLPPSQRLVAHEKSADTNIPGNQKKILEGCLLNNFGTTC